MDTKSIGSDGAHAATAQGGHPEPKGLDNDASAVDIELEHQPYVDVTYKDIFKQFVLLGWTAFGGPAAHIGLFQTRCDLAAANAAALGS